MMNAWKNILQTSIMMIGMRTNLGMICLLVKAGCIASKDEELYILHEFSGFGWGMDDYIMREYYSLPWIEDGEE